MPPSAPSPSSGQPGSPSTPRTPGLPYVIAVDAGGTHTRVGCFGLDGTLLGGARGGGGSPTHNHDAIDNVAGAVAAAVTDAGVRTRDAVALAAGMAAYRTGADNPWVDACFAALGCPRTVVNDAVIAHRGALAGRPGVIVVAGTGSMITAVTGTGEVIENGVFEHYAGGARHLVFDAMHRVLLGEATEADAGLIKVVLDWWQAREPAGLRRILLAFAGQDRNEIKRRYGGLAPMITAAADSSPLADAAVRGLTARTAVGIRLLAALIDDDPVPVALAGALATDPAFVSRLADDLTGTGIVITPARLDPLGGSALLALEIAGVDPAPLIDRLAVSCGPTG